MRDLKNEMGEKNLVVNGEIPSLVFDRLSGDSSPALEPERGDPLPDIACYAPRKTMEDIARTRRYYDDLLERLSKSYNTSRGK